MAARDKTSLSAMRCGLLAAAMAAATVVQAPAQTTTTGVPNALQGFSENKGEPIEIESARLEVRDKQGIATFSGDVKVVQGDTTMRCKVLVVFYDRSDSGADKSGAAKSGSGKTSSAKTGTAKTTAIGPGGSQQINRMEARGGVTVTQKENTATGDSGLFDMRTNTATLIGNVVVSQGQNVLRGDRLVVDMTTGVSRVDASKSHGPVRMLIQQKSQGADGQPNASPLSPLSRPLSSN